MLDNTKMDKQAYAHTQPWLPKTVWFKHTGKTQQQFEAVLHCLTSGILLTYQTWTLGPKRVWLYRELGSWWSPEMDASGKTTFP